MDKDRKPYMGRNTVSKKIIHTHVCLEERSVGTLGGAYLKIKKKPMNDDLRSIHKLISTHRKNIAYDFNPNVGLFMAQGFI